MHPSLIVSVFLAALLVSADAKSVEPKSVALEAINTLFVKHDLATFEEFVSPEAIQGDREPGSAIAKLQKQTAGKMQAVDLNQVLFFKASDIETLAKTYPDNLWPRVQKHIGENQGVLVRLALTGERAERATAAGIDPKNIAMMTFVISGGPEPKIVHVDDN